MGKDLKRKDAGVRIRDGNGCPEERGVGNPAGQLSSRHYRIPSLRKTTFLLAPFIRKFQKEILPL